MKRFLNKIIFINSASVPYSEVSLDGNIHFVGSNGFGKTTVLRAILFFYHATSDKRTLSIREDQKSFSSYYFAEENSYLLYEVMLGKNYFTVMVYKKGGKLNFRFIDTAYNKDFFIQNYKANTYEETFTALRKNSISFSEDLQRYADFRKVLYGESTNKLFKNYSLFQPNEGSKKRKLANIPHLISNIFRTSKLDSKHIKKSIVEAVFEDSVKPLDLVTIERQLNKFKIDVRDLDAYEKNESLAKELVEINDKVKSLEENLFEYANKLGLAIKNYSKKTEKITKEIGQTKNSLEKNETTFQQKEREFTESTDKLKANITLISRDLEEIENLKAKYSKLNISDAKNRTLKKDVLEEELKRINEEIKDYHNIDGDLEQKYKNRELNIKAEKSQFLERLNEQKHQIQLDFSQNIFSLKQAFEVQKNSNYNRYNAELETFKEEITSIQQKIKEVEYRLSETPFDASGHEKIEDLKLKKLKQESLIKTIEHEQAKLKTKISSTEENYQIKLKSVEEKFHYRNEDTEEKIQNSRLQIKASEKKKEQLSGSLLDFLNKNKSNWKEDVAKVLNPDILYLKNLNPKISENDGSILGIEADWSKIKPNTSSRYIDLEQQLNNLNKELSRYEFVLKELNEDFEKQKNTLANELLSQKSKLKSTLSEQDYEHNLELTTFKKLSLKLDELKGNLLEKQKNKETSFLESIKKDKESLVSLEKNKKRILQLRDKAIGLLSKDLATNISDSENKYHELKYALQKEETDFIKLKTEELLKLNEEKNSILKGNGLDLKFIEEKKERLKIIETELEEIKNKLEKLCEQYSYDQERILGKEELLNQKNLDLNDKLLELKESFRTKNTKDKERIEDLKEKLYQLHADKLKYESMLSEDFSSFKLNGTGVYELIQDRIENPKGDLDEKMDIKSILQILNSHYNHLQVNLANLQKKVHRFTGQFSNSNFLNFPSSRSFEQEKHYSSFIDHKLSPFVKHDSIQQAKEQIEKIHAELIGDIAYDTKDFSFKTGEIEKTIKQINRDFGDTNFVGVVKSIALDYRENTSPLIKVLNRLRVFSEKNNFSSQSDMFKSTRSREMDKESIKLLLDLKTAIDQESKDEIAVEDTFNLWFRILENNNDTGWVEKLSNVGSEGTDVLVKSMIYITLLNVFKESSFQGKNDDSYIHCMIDEVGKLSDRYLRELIEFTNTKNIRLIFGSPNENDPLIYKHVYKLQRDNNKVRVVELVGEV